MLSIVNRLAVADLARREQIRITASANRPWFGAQHPSQSQVTGADLMPEYIP
jgi:hypothetical protein